MGRNEIPGTELVHTSAVRFGCLPHRVDRRVWCVRQSGVPRRAYQTDASWRTAVGFGRVGHPAYGHVWVNPQRFECARRRDRLAWFSGAGTFKDDLLHADIAHQRHSVVALALSHLDLWRL